MRDYHTIKHSFDSFNFKNIRTKIVLMLFRGENGQTARGIFIFTLV
jgi:hypothetical protein